MNDTAWQTGGAIFDGGPVWLTLSFVLIGLGILFALFVLAWGTRLAKRRQQARQELEERGELGQSGAPAPVQPVTAPPVSPSPPPIADAPVVATAPEPEPAPQPAPLADEPIPAAAPLDASPATLAASDPAPAVSGTDELTRMKGVGPKLAERLNALGITSFAQLAALSPAEAEALDAQLGNFQGRIHRDRWIEQAGFLARGDAVGYEAVFGKL